jgi:PIN domain nuclease of toxin-antitoxin system
MVVLDTHAFIWWCNAPDRLSKAARQAAEEADVRLVPAISVWEIGMLVAKGRLGFDRDVATWVDEALSLPGVQLAPLSASIALRASALPGELHGDPADRLIVATAIDHACALVTKDDLILRYPNVRAVW